MVLLEVAGGTLIVLIVVGNLLIMLAFCLRPVLRKNPSYWYITSLAIVDFLVGIIGVPPTMFESLSQRVLTDHECDLLLTLHLISIVPTFPHLLTISLDRYFKLISPLKYMKNMTLGRALLVILLIWSTTIVTVLLFMIPKHDYGPSCFVILYPGMEATPYHIWLFFLFFQYIPYSLLLFCSFRVYMIASRFKNAVQHQLRQPKSKDGVQLRYHSGRLVADTSYNTHLIPGCPLKPPPSREAVIVCLSSDSELVKVKRLYEWMSTAVKQRKVALLITCIVTSAGVCWLGASTTYLLTWFCAKCRVRGTWIQIFHPWLLYLNSALNPLLLLFMSEDFRKAYSKARSSTCRPNGYVRKGNLAQALSSRS